MDERTTQLLVAVIGSGFFTWAGPALFRRWQSWRQGAEKRKRQDLDRMAAEKAVAEARAAAALVVAADAEKARDDAVEDRRAAERERDDEAALRRRYAESLSLHRRIITEAECLDPSALPDWPA
ncbi:hypothetical protein [Leucobacter musarum]|uniref:hypothetical protein n=1 Tax=Leucobacter musarum TaxID=1930747 RepID=UPI0006A79982|nr:hypothetical protein [Leucobacter musarum]